MDTTCLYETLGVSRQATTEEITQRYKALAKKHHPNRHVNKPEAEKAEHAERFKAISDANEVLSDPQKRHAYDTFGQAGTGASANDAAAQAMFEQMFGVGASAPQKPRGVVGGALFYDAERKHFFQRRSGDAEALRREVTEGHTPETLCTEGNNYEASTSLPSGMWELRLVETEADNATVVVTLVAEADDTDGATENVAPRASLRCSRTFCLPPDADVITLNDDAIDVQPGRISLRVAKKRPAETVPSAPFEETATGEAWEEAPAAVEEPSTPPRERCPAKRRAARRADKGSGMRAGFLKGASRKAKPRRVDFGEQLKEYIDAQPMQLDKADKENTEQALDMYGKVA